ncbi:uncharacterized protein LOC144580729 [Callithrix jacchus]
MGPRGLAKQEPPWLQIDCVPLVCNCSGLASPGGRQDGLRMTAELRGRTCMKKPQGESRGSSAASQPQACPDGVQASYITLVEGTLKPPGAGVRQCLRSNRDLGFRATITTSHRGHGSLGLNYISQRATGTPNLWLPFRFRVVLLRGGHSISKPVLVDLLEQGKEPWMILREETQFPGF